MSDIFQNISEIIFFTSGNFPSPLQPHVADCCYGLAAQRMNYGLLLYDSAQCVLRKNN